MPLSPGMVVEARGRRFRVMESHVGGSKDESPVQVLRLQALDDPSFTLSVITPPEPIHPVETRPPSLERPGRLALFRLFHQALLLESSGIGPTLLAPHIAPIRREEYQFVLVRMALTLPRPRLLIADDVGLGKTIEAGLILTELHARHRANRVLIVCPASLTRQWQREMAVKFGFPFIIFDRSTLAQKRRELEAGVNPWAYEPRIITSMDFLKRPDGAFREVQGLHWDVVIVDEAHHLAPAGVSEGDKQLTRLARFLAEASDALLLLTATPHNGYDESMAALLRWLDPTLAPPGPLEPRRYRRHYIRRLKHHVRNPDGSSKFVLREPVRPIRVPLSEDERRLHGRVRAYAEAIWRAAEEAEPQDRMAFQFVATVLCKRAVSSRAALRGTLERRLRLLRERLEGVEADRELLRRWKRGEPLSPEEQRKLENDAYSRYLSAMRYLKRQHRELESEVRQVEDLLDHLNRLEQAGPDPKLRSLGEYLQALHRSEPDRKVLVFSEYVDTVHAVAEFLRSHGYDGRVATATGEDPEADQRAAIRGFLFGDQQVLVATDIAAEGLNLHYTCHHLVHFELPWNPNRMEQRNGRIDRYGQTRAPVIAFLYLADTYEDDVLARLLQKLDRQLRAQGTVSDILGTFQQERLEELLMTRRSSDDVEQVLEALVTAPTPREPLMEGEDDELLIVLRKTLPDFPWIPRLADFLQSAVRLAGGRTDSADDERATVRTPPDWMGLIPGIRDCYELYISPPDDPTLLPEAILHAQHPLVQAALQWFHRLRFEPDREETRIAYQVVPGLAEPEMLVTFLVTIPDATGATLTLLEPVRVTRTSVSSDSLGDRQCLAQALDRPGANVQVETLRRLFEDWWEDGRGRARDQAQQRVEGYVRQIQLERREQLHRFKAEWEAWVRATEESILGD